MNIDTLSLIVYECNPRFIIGCRAVNKMWKIAIDQLTANQWKSIYSYHTGLNVDVSDDFDWKIAAVSACTSEASILARWDANIIRMVAPCTHVGLRVGIVSNINTVIETHGCCLDYVYDNAFCVRAIRRTCKKQANKQYCTHCKNPRNKRSCLTPAYSYYIRKYGDIAIEKLNESIALRVRVQV